jgi:two-component system sensor histidine kinase SenX3
VRHVASNHGGDVSVTSVEGEGSTFVLRLPISVDDASMTQSSGTSEGVA